MNAFETIAAIVALLIVAGGALGGFALIVERRKVKNSLFYPCAKCGADISKSPLKVAYKKESGRWEPMHYICDTCGHDGLVVIRTYHRPKPMNKNVMTKRQRELYVEGLR